MLDTIIDKFNIYVGTYIMYNHEHRCDTCHGT